MTDAPSSSDTRPLAGSNPPPWALAEIRDDSKSLGDPTATTLPAVANGSPGSKVSSKPSRMVQPSDFYFGKELGSGSWSTVMEASHVNTGKLYAVKILSKAQLIKLKKVKYATIEKDALVKLSGKHPGVVRMHAAFQDETSLYFVLDLATHGDLADLVKKHGSLSLRCARWYTAQIVDAILWVHSKGIVHRDMKPENVLLDDELRVKLADFGSAYMSTDGDLSPRASSFVGSAAYVSPELLDRSSKTTSSSSDIWAVGCTLYFMVAGTPAFAAINDYQSFRKIETLDYSFPDGFYDLAKNFVQKLVVLDPSDRLGVEPKSSPSQLRGHPLFTEPVDSVSPEEPAGMPISWDTLWIDPPVCPETGIVQPALAAALPEDEDDSLWDNVVHEFSLVNLNTVGANGNAKGSGGPHSPTSLLLPTGPPLDVPPDVVPTEATKAMDGVDARPPPTEDDPADNDSVSEDAQDVSDAAVPVAPPIAVGNSEPAHDDLGDVDDPVLKGKDWSGVLATGETVRCVSSVKTPVRRGLYKHPRPCALILTTSPRVLCVPLDDADKASKKLEAKHVFVFPKRPVGKSPSKGGKVLAGCKADSGRRKLVLLTGEKEYTFELSDEAALVRWAREVTAVLDAQ
ncbi:transporter [Ganoderma sinense ZZ0214-1]|uniref:non-specific serine/threonine protein kinase n=1 Tax=Ganoderma sinense ZZ0214-1 TaxID=1077348 RepID=A0A2G8RPU4_9APHY|nr:transporter [Ganoderma sinense ZZ0214-1]